MQQASAPVQLSTRSSLAALEAALELFRTLRVEMPIQVPLVFLLIAQRKGISAAELSKRTGLSQSAISRNVSTLAKEGRSGEPGLGLIIKTIDPANPRAHALYLSKEGRAMAARLAEVLAKAVRMRRPVETEVVDAPQVEAPMAASAAPKPFAGTHWEVWVD